MHKYHLAKTCTKWKCEAMVFIRKNWAKLRPTTQHYLFGFPIMSRIITSSCTAGLLLTALKVFKLQSEDFPWSNTWFVIKEHLHDNLWCLFCFWLILMSLGFNSYFWWVNWCITTLSFLLQHNNIGLNFALYIIWKINLLMEPLRTWHPQTYISVQT